MNWPKEAEGEQADDTWLYMETGRGGASCRGAGGYGATPTFI